MIESKGLLSDSSDTCIMMQVEMLEVVVTNNLGVVAVLWFLDYVMLDASVIMSLISVRRKLSFKWKRN